jgi:hypothetical protein
MSSIRVYQQAAIDRLLARPDKRLILAHPTGSGKTRTALEAAKAMGAESLLIFGSASSRLTWVREAERWWPEVQVHNIRWGKANKSLTKREQVARDLAYAAKHQVISYTLAKHLDASPRSLVIIDESHKLKSPTSQQSRIVKAFLRAHPDVPVLALTATPIPNELQDIWNLVDTLFPGYLGEEDPDTGDISWSFKRQYCLKELREWDGGSATVYHGANPLTLPRLRKKLEPIMHVVSASEVAQFAPELQASILWIDDPKQTDVQTAAEWLEAREADGSTHVGLFAWHHVTARQLADVAREAGWVTTIITGSMHPEQRQIALDVCRQAPRCCIIGTAGSLMESISLAFIKQALVFEWRATPGQALQFAGRFPRPDGGTESTYLQYVARPDDESAAKTLRARLDVVADLQGKDEKTDLLRELMAPRALTEEYLHQLSLAMFSESRVSLGGFIDEEGNDDD